MALNLSPTTVAAVFVVLSFAAFLTTRLIAAYVPRLFPWRRSGVAGIASQFAYGTLLNSALLFLLLFVLSAYWSLLVLLVSLLLLSIPLVLNVVQRNLTTPDGRAALVRRFADALWRDPLELGLTSLSLLIFGYLTVFMRWPPPGDITSLHGPIVALLLTGGYPAAGRELSYFYPLGFHAYPASVAGAFGLYPGEAILVYGAFLTALIPVLMYSIARKLGASRLLALLAFAGAFVAHPSLNLEEWVLGAFFNGPYPNLMGYLGVLLLAEVLIEHLNGPLGRAELKAYAWVAGPLIFALLPVYPTFAAILAIHLVLLGGWVILPRQERRYPKLGEIASLFMVAVGMVALGAFLLSPTLSVGLNVFSDPNAARAPYRLDPLFLVDNLSGWMILVGGFLVAWEFVRGRHVGVCSLYLLIAGLLLISLVPFLYPYVWVVLPMRTVIILVSLAWPFVAAGISRRIEEARVGTRLQPVPRPTLVGFSEKMQSRYQAVFIAGLLIVGQGALIYTITPPKEVATFAWFTHSANFDADFGAAEWLVRNAGPADLILSDGSFAARNVLALGPLSLSGSWFYEYRNPSDFQRLDAVWQNPWDIEYALGELQSHGARFVLSTSEEGFLRMGTHHEYLPKVYTPSEYASIFQGYPFLSPSYVSGSTRVFRVMPSSLQISTNLSYPIASASAFWNQTPDPLAGTSDYPILDAGTPSIFTQQGSRGTWRIEHNFSATIQMNGFEYLKLLIDVRTPSAKLVPLEVLMVDERGLAAGVELHLGNGQWTSYIPLGRFAGLDLSRIHQLAIAAGSPDVSVSPEDVISINLVAVSRLDFTLIQSYNLASMSSTHA